MNSSIITYSGRNSALAPLPPGTLLRYGPWTPEPFKATPGSAMERVARRLKPIPDGPEGAIVGMSKLGPVRSIWVDDFRARDNVPAHEEEVARYTTGVYGWHPKTGA